MKYFDMFAGAGGFTIGINRAYETLCDADRSENRGSQEDSERNQGQGLLPKKVEEINSKERPASECNNDISNERPLCIGYSEIDKYAIQTYEKNFNHKNYGDCKKINWSEVPDFDLLVGGSPCQDLSIAGKRAGLDGERSGLFAEYIRALKEKKPQHFIWENVKGALSSNKGWDFAEVLFEMEQAGYSLQWQVLNAKDFGVPQNRERIFVIGTRGTCGREVFPFADNSEATTIVSGQCSNTLTFRYYGGQANGTYVIESKLDAQEVRVKEATKKGYSIAHQGDSINLSVPNSKTRRGRVGKGIAQTIDTGMQQHTLHGSRIRRLTPAECERLMSWPDNHTEGVSDSQRYKQCGNGVVSNVVKAIVKRLIY